MTTSQDPDSASIERILAIGPPAGGKTEQAIRLAAWLQPTGAQVYVLDTDDSWPRMLTGRTNLLAKNGGNVHISFAYGWEEYIQWIEETLPKIVPQKDWLIVDRVDKAWPQVRAWFSQEVYKQELSERLLAIRKAMRDPKTGVVKSAMVLGGFDKADWQGINASYLGWFFGVLYKSRAHIYLTAAVNSVRSNDDAEIVEIFAPLGMKPAGQKSLPYEVHTVLVLYNKKGQYLVSTAKDRKRVYLSSAPMVSLPLQYLVGIAGWSRDS